MTLALVLTSVFFITPVASASGPGNYLLKERSQLETTICDSLECLDRAHPQIAALGYDIEKISKHYLNIATQAKKTMREPDFFVTTSLQKVYLSLRKLLKYCKMGHVEQVLATRDPRFQDESSPILGARAEAAIALKNFSQDHSYLLNYIKHLYESPSECTAEDGDPKAASYIQMLPISIKEQASEIARKQLESYFDSFKLPKNYGEPFLDNPGYNRTVISDLDNEWNDWNMQPMVDRSGVTKGRFFVPAEVVLIHELGHVERTLPGDSKISSDEDPIVEIGVTLDQIILQDEIYKKVKGLSLDQEVSYPCRPKTNRGVLTLGKLANTFRDLRKKYGSVDRALISDEARVLLSRFY